VPEVKLRSGQDRVYLTRPQAEALVRCPEVPEHRRVRYLLALTSGMRDGELSGLTWADVDLDAKPPRCEISKALALRGDEGFATLGDTKTDNSKRTLPLHALAVRALRAWKAKGWAEFAGHKPTATDSIFASPEGTPWRPQSARLIREDLKAAKQYTKVGQTNIDFHACRRSFMTWLVEAEVPSDIIDMLVGHAGKSTRARHYTAHDIEVMAKAVAKVQLEVTTGEVVALPLALAVGNNLAVDDGPPDDYPAAVPDTDDPAISGLLPAELPAARGCPTGSDHESSIIDAPALVAQRIEQRFPNRLPPPQKHQPFRVFPRG
jgi:site-specific recombinase XerD